MDRGSMFVWLEKNGLLKRDVVDDRKSAGTFERERTWDQFMSRIQWRPKCAVAVCPGWQAKLLMRKRVCRVSPVTVSFPRLVGGAG